MAQEPRTPDSPSLPEEQALELERQRTLQLESHVRPQLPPPMADVEVLRRRLKRAEEGYRRAELHARVAQQRQKKTEKKLHRASRDAQQAAHLQTTVPLPAATYDDVTLAKHRLLQLAYEKSEAASPMHAIQQYPWLVPIGAAAAGMIYARAKFMRTLLRLGALWGFRFALAKGAAKLIDMKR